MSKRGGTRRREPRTNAMRMLDARKVPYKVLTFSEDIHSATEAAQALGADPSTVLKTLVVLRPGERTLLVMVAGDEQLDLSALAASISAKKLRMATHRDAETLTGLQVGGISALALLNKGFDVCIDCAVQHLDEVAVSAGKQGVNLRLSVPDLLRVTQARWVDATGRGLR